MPNYQPAKHHHLIADTLQKVEQGIIDRVIITMPPRHGKSELASRRFPAWFIGKNPDKQIICCSYSDDFAKDFGREVRNIVDSEEFKDIFPDVKLSADSKAANRWVTNKGGYYLAAGIGGGITGKGAHILVIDDPIKDREQADSPLMQDNIWKWYTGTAYHRLEPGGAIVVIQTRWVDDDLAGRLLEAEENEDGDKWVILNLPAINENNEALWPERYSLKDLERIRKVLSSESPRNWHALYQQNPIPEEGEFFKRDWFKFFRRSELPKELKVYGASDYAVTSEGGDFTEHGIFGVDEDDDIWIFDWWYGQTATDVWITELLRLARKHNPLTWAEESGQIIKSVGPFIQKRQQEEKNYFYRKQFPSSKDKVVRAQSFRGRAAQGKIHILKSDWGDRLLHQLVRFPAGKHDDAVDVCSLLSRMLSELIRVQRKVPRKKGKFPQQMTINELIEMRSRKRRQEEWDS